MNESTMETDVIQCPRLPSEVAAVFCNFPDQSVVEVGSYLGSESSSFNQRVISFMTRAAAAAQLELPC